MKRWWTRARELSEFAAFRLVAAVLGALPLEVASAASGRLWRFAAPRLKRHRRAIDNLALAYPETSAAERERVAAAMWDNLGRTFAEFFHLQRLVGEDRITFEPLERFEQIAKGGPCVICAMHMGNWELLAHFSARFGVPLAGVYQSLTNPLVDQWLLERRAPLYPGGLHGKTPATARALLRLAREGGYPAFLADQRAGNGVLVPFFGRPARSSTFPALIARTLGLPLYAARIRRKPGVTFSVRIEPVEIPHTRDREADIRVATANTQAKFEEFVREAPEQWMWAHRRWD